MSATATKLLNAIVAKAMSLAILFGAIQGLRLRPSDCASRESTCACAPRKSLVILGQSPAGIEWFAPHDNAHAAAQRLKTGER